MRGLFVALTLMAAVPADAQTDPSGHPTIPPEFLVPNEQARSFIDALKSQPLSDEMMERVIRAMPGGSAGPMDEIIAQMFAPGPIVPGWQNLGVSAYAIVARLEGGLGAYMMEGTNEFGPVYGYFVDRPLESLLPPEWVLIGRRGTSSLTGPVQILVSHVSPGVILVERATGSRHGNASCRGPAESRLYADPTVAASEQDAVTAVFTMRLLAAVEHRSLCEIVEELGQRAYRARYFDAEGHGLDAFDRGSISMRIVAFRPVLSAPALH